MNKLFFTVISFFLLISFSSTPFADKVNTSYGKGALERASGSANTAFGGYAAQANTTGYDNTAVGYVALQLNKTGSKNTAVGICALGSMTKGERNTAVGNGALCLMKNGSRNAAFGNSALLKNLGSYNSAFGADALESNTSGNRNSAVGSEALKYLKTGKFNTAIGAYAGWRNVTGSSNVFIGYKAGLNEKGSYKLYIANTSTKKPLMYGDFLKKTLKVNGKMYATKFITSSDKRLKENIQPLSGALSAVLQLQGKSYRLLDQPSGTNDIGLIAQDVEKVLPEIISQTEDGYKAIAYQSLTAVLIEAIKEQQQQMTTQQGQLAALEKENTHLKAIMAEQMETLLARVAMLERIQVVAN